MTVRQETATRRNVTQEGPPPPPLQWCVFLEAPKKILTGRRSGRHLHSSLDGGEGGGLLATPSGWLRWCCTSMGSGVCSVQLQVPPFGIPVLSCGPACIVQIRRPAPRPRVHNCLWIVGARCLSGFPVCLCAPLSPRRGTTVAPDLHATGPVPQPNRRGGAAGARVAGHCVAGHSVWGDRSHFQLTGGGGGSSIAPKHFGGSMAPSNEVTTHAKTVGGVQNGLIFH